MLKNLSIIPEISPELQSLLLSYEIDIEDWALDEILGFFEERYFIKTSFDDRIKVYSLVNNKSGKRMSSPYRENNQFEERLIKHIISLI